jgi:riboflavin biosynthesis pyrimidine reductase
LSALRRLLPDPGEIAPEEVVAGLAGRETLVVNMVAAVDGRAALDGRTAPLSPAADRAVFHLLRAQADAVLVGAPTLRAEHYRRFTKSEELRERRAAAGLDPEPLGVVIARSGDVPWDVPLFHDPAARVAVYTGAAASAPPPLPANVSVHPLTDPAAVLAHLRAEHGVRCVLCEGGPTLNAALFGAGLVDELFLTLTPLLTGNEAPLTILEGRLPAPLSLELRQVVEAGGALLLRYRVTG